MRRIDRSLTVRTRRASWAAGVLLGLSVAVPAPQADAADRKRDDAADKVLSAETQLNLGRRFEARGDIETALGLYQKAVTEKPDNEEALRALVGLAVRTNRAGAVFDHAVRLAEKHPNDAEAQLWLAASLNERGRAAEALEALAQAENAGAEKAGSGTYAGLLWLQRGIAHDVAGNHLEAQRAFSHAITLNPGAWQLPMRLALSLALQGDYPAALRILQMQVNDPAMEQPVRETLAIIYALSGQTEQAMDIARTVTDKELADSQRGYLEMLPKLSAPGRAYAAHYRRINEALGTAAPTPVPAPKNAPAPKPEPQPQPKPQPKPAEAVSAPLAAPAPVPGPAVQPAPKVMARGEGYWLQLASLVSREKAVQAWDEARRNAGATLEGRQAFVQTTQQGSTTFHRLMTGPFETMAAARGFAAKLGAQGIKPVIKRDVGDIEPLDR